MKRLIVADATPIIAFSKINRLTLLQEIVEKIIIPEEVSRELFAYGKPDAEKLRPVQLQLLGRPKWTPMPLNRSPEKSP